jgi:hypothetical protein
MADIRCVVAPGHTLTYHSKTQKLLSSKKMVLKFCTLQYLSKVTRFNKGKLLFIYTLTYQSRVTLFKIQQRKVINHVYLKILLERYFNFQKMVDGGTREKGYRYVLLYLKLYYFLYFLGSTQGKLQILPLFCTIYNLCTYLSN